MKLTTLRLNNFKCFGPATTEVGLTDVSYVLGSNGSGKTAVLEALTRLFGSLPAQRVVRVDDFHIPLGRSAIEVHAEQPTLWLELDIEFPEAGADGQHPSVPPNFSHMSIETEDGVPRIRVRLTAQLSSDGEVEEQLEYILQVDETGEPASRADMSRYDRRHIEVHYLPARRDPVDHIGFASSSLIGRILRATDWSAERDSLTQKMDDVTVVLTDNGAVSAIGKRLAAEWSGLHSGAFFKDPAIAFGRGELEGVLRQLTVNFSPSHGDAPLAFDRLSDGQKSLLYLSLVLAWQTTARQLLNGEEPSLDVDRLHPPVHSVIALEEPENSLAPQYLGRIIRQLRGACGHGDVQAVIATHAPALLRRVDPEAICFLRLNSERETLARRIVLPSDDEAAAKYVREAVEAYPELYFSRLVVLGEGDSEQVVLPRVLAAAGIAEDDASVSVVPLGGRHVNHFWRLLTELEIPYVTLLDLDAGRYQGGWGRVTNALRQINKVTEPPLVPADKLEDAPKWDADRDFPQLGKATKALNLLERHGVFFSHPLDLDLMMLEAFPDAYDAEPDEPDEATIVAVLGKSHVNEARLGGDRLALFDSYHATFNLGSKPAAHLAALSTLTDDELLAALPAPLGRLVEHVEKRLAELPE